MTELEKAISELESRLAACGDAGWCTMSAELLERVIGELKRGETRVLTLDEVRADPSKPVWIEKYDFGAECAEMMGIARYTGKYYFASESHRDWSQFGLLAVSWDYFGRPDDEYGRSWRVWNDKPSDEQREAVEWDD